AISQDRVAHAYIFAGPRGVGKTTTARILAKALNCQKGPSPEPCNSCASCIEITKGSSLDILELDGASNRGIDEIRNLRDNVKFAPSKGAFKVYIIDEVHMLTPEAFNALLKILEEPPPHVKFIFATTQAHKVPPTIISRCQRFDFRRLSAKDILANLKRIAEKENLDVNDDALILIAKYSDGSMRDGQVMLDQIMSFTEGRVDVKDIVKVLGIVDEEMLFGLSASIKAKDAVSALKIIDILINEGKDAVQVVSGLIEHFRNICVIKISKELDSLINAGPDRIKRYAEEAQKYTVEEILYIIYTFANTIDFIKRVSLARVPLEAAMVKLTRSGSITSLAEIIERINNLEARLQGGRAQQEPELTVEQDRLQAKPEDSNMNGILSSWTGVINYVKAKKISIGSYLEEASPLKLEANTLSIGFPKELGFHKEMLELAENGRLIDEAIREVMKLDLKVVYTLVEPVNMQGRALNANSGKANEEAEDASHQEEAKKPDDDPIIKLALEVFDGQILKNRNEKR
ncbi:MAG: DNA polymerase III subunit gamma/tau, partial [Candidatus Omnitrophica bacterium]|nr:DNA polymerase III subunit gamma/tau [Candidatus Omnitrophota bacterium]